jgi:hypothetical protein
LKSKYFNKEYKKPLCVDIEDVRVNKISDEKHGNNINLGTSQDHFEVKHEVEKREDDDVKNRLIDNSQKVENILKRSFLRILPPTIMMTLKVCLMLTMESLVIESNKKGTYTF